MNNFKKHAIRGISGFAEQKSDECGIVVTPGLGGLKYPQEAAAKSSQKSSSQKLWHIAQRRDILYSTLPSRRRRDGRRMFFCR
jgi:hypothetical protein